MSTFLLVPGLHLGGWAWDTVVAELTAHGHRALPVTLPGLAERAGEDPAAIGLQEHTDTLADRLGAEEPGVILVAHSYGIFPTLAAADRLPGKVARLVLVDTGLPEAGESVLTLMPHLLDAADGPVLRVPQQIDAVHGVPAAEWERYRRLATPHPARTVTEPIKLTDAWRALPTTGILCVHGGLTLETVRSLHATGAPRFAGLAEPGVTYFELPTGHYPMLSTPVELADVLIRAAAGGGRGLLEP
ncbi:alpha/beta fold hydrolase [Streptomyces tropicalis]|uniref:Alpha/beta fold hydrolase n=1 Tax=Streptomyces tropicalis TaxID=3034234 RepID=A0ABT6AAD8_9ACTN|nr:alpha/beta fold hydrolase [Streptomyces tropicalis]MDF3301402.1 alpha/beta fold hydrolase [Streptomyces tropicalis]